MTITQIILSFFVIWSLCVFLMLPAGIQTPDNPAPLEAQGAPKKTFFMRKLFAAALLAVLFTGLLYAIIHYKLVQT
ncbi:MAG: DUF1467 family protein [Rickettsiales bacterium]|nr:DUF1467 family protein [Rickettsiales bacterium]